jgi:hypothetical protein
LHDAIVEFQLRRTQRRSHYVRDPRLPLCTRRAP